MRECLVKWVSGEVVWWVVVECERRDQLGRWDLTERACVWVSEST